MTLMAIDEATRSRRSFLQTSTGVGAAVLGALARFAPAARRPAVIASTYAIGAVASFWFIERIWA